MVARWPQIVRWGLERCPPPDFGAPVNFREHSFYEKSRRLRRKEKRKEKRKEEKENNDVYSGHYVIASRPPERRPTGTPHARANKRSVKRI